MAHTPTLEQVGAALTARFREQFEGKMPAEAAA